MNANLKSKLKKCLTITPLSKPDANGWRVAAVGDFGASTVADQPALNLPGADTKLHPDCYRKCVKPGR